MLLRLDLRLKRRYVTDASSTKCLVPVVLPRSMPALKFYSGPGMTSDYVQGAFTLLYSADLASRKISAADAGGEPRELFGCFLMQDRRIYRTFVLKKTLNLETITNATRSTSYAEQSDRVSLKVAHIGLPISCIVNVLWKLRRGIETPQRKDVAMWYSGCRLVNHVADGEDSQYDAGTVRIM